jgi:hypothetical protein
MKENNMDVKKEDLLSINNILLALKRGEFKFGDEEIDAYSQSKRRLVELMERIKAELEPPLEQPKEKEPEKKSWKDRKK